MNRPAKGMVAALVMTILVAGCGGGLTSEERVSIMRQAQEAGVYLNFRRIQVASSYKEDLPVVLNHVEEAFKKIGARQYDRRLIGDKYGAIWSMKGGGGLIFVNPVVKDSKELVTLVILTPRPLEWTASGYEGAIKILRMLNEQLTPVAIQD